MVCIATEESFYILRYNAEAVEKAKDQPDAVTEDGVEEAFDVCPVLYTHFDFPSLKLFITLNGLLRCHSIKQQTLPFTLLPFAYVWLVV